MRSEITQASNGPGSSILIVFIADWLRIYGKSENYYQAELAKELPTSCEIIPLSNCLYHQALFCNCAVTKGAIIFYREGGASACDRGSPIFSGPPLGMRKTKLVPPLGIRNKILVPPPLAYVKI